MDDLMLILTPVFGAMLFVLVAVGGLSYIEANGNDRLAAACRSACEPNGVKMLVKGQCFCWNDLVGLLDVGGHDE